MSITEGYQLAGARVLVTGAGTGIGRAITLAFLEQGAKVLLAGRRRGPLDDVVRDQDPDRVLICSADMSNAQQVQSVVDTAREAWGGIDVVVANAGLSEPGTIEELDAASWERMRSINLDGLIYLAQAVVPELRASGGSLTAISSVAGLGGDWRQTGYNATKAAANALVQAMALDLGQDGVRVNAVAPGFTRTVLTQERLDDPAFSAKLADRLGIQRAADPREVADAVVFLSSARASYITGVVLPVDGGMSAGNGSPRPV